MLYDANGRRMIVSNEDQYSEPYYGPWEMTPWWHPARWFGFDIRRYQNHEPYDRGWNYDKSQIVARYVLSRCYEPEADAPTQQAANYIAGNDGHGNL